MMAGALLKETMRFNTRVLRSVSKLFSDLELLWLTKHSQGLGTSQIVPVPRTPILNNGLPMEELDLEYEQQLDRDLEGLESGPNDDDREVLRGKFRMLQLLTLLIHLIGTWVPYRRSLTGKKSSAWDDRRIQKLLAKSPDLFSIPAGNRGTVYRYFERVINKIMLQKVKTLLNEYQAIVKTTAIIKVNDPKLPKYAIY